MLTGPFLLHSAGFIVFFSLFFCHFEIIFLLFILLLLQKFAGNGVFYPVPFALI